MVEVAKRLLRPPDLTSVLEAILSQIRTLFGYPICAVLLVDRATNELYAKAQMGCDPEIALKTRLRIGEQGISGWVAHTGQTYYASDVRTEPRYYEVVPAARSNVAFPLVIDDQVIGVLDVESPQVDAFPPDVREVLEAFATLAALAIYRAQRDEELRRLAQTDGLTGLANHRAMREGLAREIARAQRSGKMVAIVVVEVDGFKQINDRHGHLRGDEVLRAVGDVLWTGCREMDLAARFGGDEFLLLLPETSKDDAAQVATRLRDCLQSLRFAEGFRVTASFGVAGFPDDGADADAILEAADEAMYRVKRAGGNSVASA